MEIYLVVIIAMVALGIGVAVTFVLNKTILSKQATELIKEAEAKAEVIKKDRMLEAKERFIQLKSEHEKEVMARNQNVQNLENKLKQKEQPINQKLEQATRKDSELDQIKATLTKQLEIVSAKKEEAEKALNNQVKQLEKIAGLSADEAKKQLVEALHEEAKTEAPSFVGSQ